MVESLKPYNNRLFSSVNGYVAILALFVVFYSNTFAAPPELLEARWMTKGENPIYLDLYPLYGRDASTVIYVQADLRGTEPIEGNQIDIWLENPFLLPDTFNPSGFEEIIKGNGGDATVKATLFVDNDINWPQYTEGATLTLKMSARDSAGEEAIYDLGEICLYGLDPGGAQPDLTPPSGIADTCINNGEPIVLPDVMEENFLEFPASTRALDAGKGIEDISLFYYRFL